MTAMGSITTPRATVILPPVSEIRGKVLYFNPLLYYKHCPRRAGRADQFIRHVGFIRLYLLRCCLLGQKMRSDVTLSKIRGSGPASNRRARHHLGLGLERQ